MNIAIFADYYLPTIGGVQTSIHEQKMALESRGHTVTIVTVNYDEYRDDPTFVLIPTAIKYSFGGHTHKAFIPFPGSDEWIMRRIRKRSIDIIHVQTDFSVGVLGMRVGKKLGIPVVYTPHTLLWKPADLASVWQNLPFSPQVWLGVRVYCPGPILHPPRRAAVTWFAWQYCQLIATLAINTTMVITPSAHLRNTLLSWGVSVPIRLRPNYTNSIPDILPLPKKPHFLWAGRMSEEKRPLDFIAALDIVSHETGGNAFEATMAGAGHYGHQLARHAAQCDYPLDVGSRSVDKMSQCYQDSSILVMTSADFDNQPMVIAESILHGRGVVLVDTNLQEGLSDGAGVWTKDASAQSLADELVALIRHPEKIQSMSQQAAKNRTLFMAKYAVKEQEAIYNEAIQRYAKT